MHTRAYTFVVDDDVVVVVTFPNVSMSMHGGAYTFSFFFLSRLFFPGMRFQTCK